MIRCHPTAIAPWRSRDIDLDELAAICRRYGIAELAVFGSVARGEERPDSDLDLFYVLAPGVRLGWEVMDLNDELAELFGRRVDLGSKRSLHRLVRDEVLAEAKVICTPGKPCHARRATASRGD